MYLEIRKQIHHLTYDDFVSQYCYVDYNRSNTKFDLWKDIKDLEISHAIQYIKNKVDEIKTIDDKCKNNQVLDFHELRVRLGHKSGADNISHHIDNLTF